MAYPFRRCCDTPVGDGPHLYGCERAISKEPVVVEKKRTVWCLFSVENLHEQPNNNLVALWFERPSIETLARHFHYSLSEANDETVLKLVAIWQGKGARLPPLGETDYRLQEVTEGEKL